MTALNVFGDPGGWPLSMFLTPDGKPVLGFTYRPREDHEEDGKKYRGFKSIANLVAGAWKDQKDGLLEQADKIAKTTTDTLTGLRVSPLFKIDREQVKEAIEGVSGMFDKQHGGFGSPERNFRGTKFPLPSKLVLLEEEAVRTKSEELAHIVHVTLTKMAQGGIYDQLGGGFHRYSTERTWTVPHFEKMLYDNAQLVEVYALSWRRKQDPLYRRVIGETLDFMAREMTSPEGVFYSALDADSEEEEGRFYVWTTKELAGVLSARSDLDLFRKVYAEEGTNFDSKYTILRLKRPPAEIAAERKVSEDELLKKLEPLKKALLAERAKRPRPFLDTKVITGWNGQMIAGYAVAGKALGEKKYVETAAKAADFILKNLRNKEGRLKRTWSAAPGGKAEARGHGYLDDYAFLVHGLLCLHDATGEKKWLDEAKALTELTEKFFGGDKAGGYYYTANDHEKLFARAKDQYDGAQPCGNSMAARNLVRLWLKTKDEKYRKSAERTIRSLAIPYRSNAASLCLLGSAMGLYLDAEKK